jgi:hypothetical protein
MVTQKDIVINRKQYQDIKKMDHNQMNVYLQNVYKNAYMDGFKAGTESVPGIDISKISEILFGIKGLGAKRVEYIVAALEKELG